MIFVPAGIEGAWFIELEPKTDDRGMFARTWCAAEFARHGLDATIAQCNMSYSRRRGTLRGMHWQEAPYAENKLVRCTAGAVFDVCVDLRKGSATYLKWVGRTLTAENRAALFVPEGCAHGFLTLVDDSEVAYQVSRPYAAHAERGLRWNDPAIAIEWPGEIVVASERDRSFPDLVV